MSAESKNPYALLGVDFTATPTQIRRAYRKRIVASHRQGVLGLVDQIEELKRAYQLLRDPALRSDYDRALWRGRASSCPPAAHGDPRVAREVALRRRMGHERAEHSLRSGAEALRENAETVRQLAHEHEQRELASERQRARRALQSRLLKALLLCVLLAACVYAGLR
jgi:curved DNA-binding protein CbpA